MTEILFIGDVHGKWNSYANILMTETPEMSIQVGDFGLGFGESDHDRESLYKVMDANGANNRYIRGNHDNPAMALADPRCMADGSYDEEHGIFYLGGAVSIDAEWCIEGLDWWADEEMSYDALFSAIDLYEKVKPRIVVSHECPEDLAWQFFNWYKGEFKSRTREALASMREIHKPELHVFGHWHHNIDAIVDGTRYVCLNELNTMKVTI